MWSAPLSRNFWIWPYSTTDSYYGFAYGFKFVGAISIALLELKGVASIEFGGAKIPQFF